MLQALVDGAITRAQANDWARPWLVDDGFPVEDDLVRRTLDRLFGADLMTSPSSHLHGPADFRAWLDEFDARE
ncbi:hypothetical protein DL991_17475 [Amycolatopsis sp. WAC 01375]|uniref:hypothetical protein n=1 Tax=Amycolatopsis sp. WAC 01375 TaxID=2203194 RepID=UPI000F7A66DF|nr:hypothetical protein [Amycolatopsis sp. WAC 01375]RSM78372.1 hypothetical protein DL991_17475 [Amycolatopsis sp. WAC 01375]RSN30837.1 hypothetical protein DL990_23060 [Amycolatopsis sp. WAC 01416]